MVEGRTPPATSTPADRVQDRMHDPVHDPVHDWVHDPLDRFAPVDNTITGFTEMRTHGVSGPPPSSVLQYPMAVVTRVAGNADSGFWRRWRLGGDLDDIPGERHLEAYSWGGLTSRASLQALWLLLLPFSLVNIAHWMLPPYTDKKGGRACASVAVSLLRVLALSFTVTLALAGAEITMDLAAWQCGASPDCRERLAPWGLLATVGERTGLRLVIGGALLSLVLLLLLVAGARRLRPLADGEQAPSPLVRRFVKGRRRAGAEPGDSGEPGEPDEPDEPQPVLGDPRFWAADRSTRWLRALHAVAWCAVIGAVASGALTAVTDRGQAGHQAGVALLWANTGVLALVFLAVTPQYFGRGGRGPTRTPGYRWVNAGAVVLLAASLGVTWTYMPDSAEAGQPVLPWVHGAMGWLAFAQAVILVALAGCVGWLARGARQGPAPRAGYQPILAGWLTAVVASVGWAMGLALSAGLGLWVADRLEAAVNQPGTSRTTLRLVSPTVYTWIDVGVLLDVGVVILWLLVILGRLLSQTSKKAQIITAEQTDEPSHRDDKERSARARKAARLWVLAEAVETIPVVFAGVAVVGLALAGAAAIAHSRGVDADQNTLLLTSWQNHLASIGAWLITMGTVLLLVVAYAAYRKQSTRRIVGILWDVTTFWPRANHPVTPACSAERAVPQLAKRVASLTTKEADVLVLSAHSQGSVLAAAAVLRLQRDGAHHDRLSRMAMLTYGSPLRRLYARAFPAYFSDQVLERVSESLGGRWLNLWSHTDPVGADIALHDPAMDWRMVPDPLTLDVDPRTGEQVGVCGHTGYLKRPEYPVAVDRMRRSVIQQRASDARPNAGPLD